MTVDRIRLASALALASMLLLSCADAGAPPTAPAADGRAASADHGLHGGSPGAVTAGLEPFTFRAPLDPYRIHQLPQYMAHSTVRSDIVIQRSVFAPGAGPWHTHPGPSFIYVIEGEIKLERYDRQHGCTETPVYSAGMAYTEVAEQVHRAVVTSAQPAVLLVTRFNIPVGAPITTMVAAPGC